MLPLLRVDRIQCRLGQQEVLKTLSFDVSPGELNVLLGPSGCGKTTLLQVIAGFQRLSSGQLILDGRRIAHAQDELPPEQRGIGMVFQDYALFPHLTVSQNIGFGLRHLDRQARAHSIEAALALVQMQALAKRYPHQLSGGQQQRVALARALAPKPRLLLLDEPFSNLDTQLRQTLAFEVRDILKQAEMTAILVTHDRHEAMAISDHIGVMDQGELLQWAEPSTLYQAPVNLKVATLLNEGTILDAQVEDEGIACVFGRLPKPAGWATGMALKVFVRPSDLSLGGQGVPARLVASRFMGQQSLYTLQLSDDLSIQLLTDAGQPHAVGDVLSLRLTCQPLMFPAPSLDGAAQ